MPQLQALQAIPSLGERLGEALGAGAQEGLSSLLGQYQEKKKREGLAAQFEKAGINPAFASLDPQIVKELMKQQQKSSLIQSIMGGNQSQVQMQGDVPQQQQQPGQPAKSNRLSEQQIQALSVVDPNFARIAQSQEKAAQQRFESERKYHTQLSQKAEEKTNALRESIPKKEGAYRFAREAVESGEIGRFSKASFASLPFLPKVVKDALISGNAAKINTASKENLIGNLSKLSAKAQNQWIEQRFSSMFPLIGQSEEANLTTAEMLEGELALDNAEVKKFDEIAQQDMDKYGYVRRDIEKRVQEEIKPVHKEILNRTSYRTREIYENEKGEEYLKKHLNEKVPNGVPLTLRMGNLLFNQYGDKTLNIAKGLGYTIPNAAQISEYNKPFSEFFEQ